MTAELSSINPNTSLRGVVVSLPKCAKCNGSGVVDDGEIDCYSNGEPYENGPIKCVKDCPACGGRVSGLPVKPIKANVDLLGLIETFGKAHRKAFVPRGGRLDYWDDGDAPDMGPITAEVERLQGCEYDLGEILETTTGVLLVLSLMPELVEALRGFLAEFGDKSIHNANVRKARTVLAAATSPATEQSVARFADAVRECS